MSSARFSFGEKFGMVKLRSGEGGFERGGVVAGEGMVPRVSEKGANKELLEDGLFENPREEEDLEGGGWDLEEVVGGVTCFY
jgi:hypothetical protein